VIFLGLAPGGAVVLVHAPCQALTAAFALEDFHLRGSCAGKPFSSEKGFPAILIAHPLYFPSSLAKEMRVFLYRGYAGRLFFNFLFGVGGVLLSGVLAGGVSG